MFLFHFEWSLINLQLFAIAACWLFFKFIIIFPGSCDGSMSCYRRILGPAMMSRSMMRKAARGQTPEQLLGTGGETGEGGQEESGNGGMSFSSSGSSASSHVLLPLMTSLSMLPSMGPFGLVIAGGIVSHYCSVLWNPIIN